jgi:hypothetical protein
MSQTIQTYNCDHFAIVSSVIVSLTPRGRPANDLVASTTPNLHHLTIVCTEVMKEKEGWMQSFFNIDHNVNSNVPHWPYHLDEESLK